MLTTLRRCQEQLSPEALGAAAEDEPRGPPQRVNDLLSFLTLMDSLAQRFFESHRDLRAAMELLAGMRSNSMKPHISLSLQLPAGRGSRAASVDKPVAEAPPADQPKPESRLVPEEPPPARVFVSRRGRAAREEQVEIKTPQGKLVYVPADHNPCRRVRVASFTPGMPKPQQDFDPKDALGKPNYRKTHPRRSVSLGHGGELVVEFTDNVLVDRPGASSSSRSGRSRGHGSLDQHRRHGVGFARHRERSEIDAGDQFARPTGSALPLRQVTGSHEAGHEGLGGRPRRGHRRDRGPQLRSGLPMKRQ